MNIFDMCMLGFFTDYPLEENVEKDIEYAHKELTGTLEVGTEASYTLPLSITLSTERNLNVSLEKDGELDITVTKD